MTCCSSQGTPRVNRFSSKRGSCSPRVYYMHYITGRTICWLIDQIVFIFVCWRFAWAQNKSPQNGKTTRWRKEDRVGCCGWQRAQRESFRLWVFLNTASVTSFVLYEPEYQSQVNFLPHYFQHLFRSFRFQTAANFVLRIFLKMVVGFRIKCFHSSASDTK